MVTSFGLTADMLRILHPFIIDRVVMRLLLYLQELIAFETLLYIHLYSRVLL